MNEEIKEGMDNTSQENTAAQTSAVEGASTTPEAVEATANTESEEEQNVAVVAVEAEDDHEGPKERKLPIPDFDSMPVSQCLEVLKEHIGQYSPERIKGIVESGRSRILHELNQERDQAKATYLEEGGNIIDFHYDQPDRKTLGALYGTYRDGLRAHYAELEAELAKNLAIKQEIVEQVKALPMVTGSAKEKYETFKALREKWNATGLVPKAEARTLWANYNHHVDNFFDYLRMAYDLIERDYQNNYDEKVALIESLEAQVAAEGIQADLFRELQQAHAKWKRIGPVPREKKDELWDRFKAVTAKIHELRDAFNENMKALNDEKIAAKQEVVKAIAALTEPVPNKHGSWQKASKQLEALRAEFKKIGFVRSEENDEVWEAYKEVQREFNRLKNAFYKEEKKSQRENLEAKEALVKLAQSLQDSEDFEETAQALKKAQADWKKTGFVNKKDGDRLWNEFRAACNHFFDRMHGERKAKEKKADARVAAKQAFLKEAKSAKVKTVDDAIALSEKWNSMGPLPGKMRDMEGQFDAVLSDKLESLDMNAEDLEMTLFEAKIKALVEADDQDGLFRERNALRDQLEGAKKELVQLETNLAFFSTSKGNPLLAAAQQNIEQVKARVAHLTAMRKMFNRLLK